MKELSPDLRKPWSRFETQREAAHFGIWVFLASEFLFFGALFLGYAACRYEHPAAFVQAAAETNIVYGSLNTLLLLTSSMTMAMASKIADEEIESPDTIIVCLAATALLGIAFLVVKGFEYREDIDKLLVPGPSFKLAFTPAQIFYAFYWTMTGVHAVHLAIGIGLVTRLAWLGRRRQMQLIGSSQLQVTALYWHLVDVVWIFIYPIIYLPGRSG